MVKSIQGVLTLSQVAELIKSVKETFYATTRNGYDSRVTTYYWDSASAREMAKIDMHNYALVQSSAQQLIILKRIGARSQDLAVTVRGLYENYNDIATRIFDATLFRDIQTGQTIPSRVREFVVKSQREYCPEWAFEKFIEQRNIRIDEAQRRLKQAVSAAAFHIVDDLR